MSFKPTSVLDWVLLSYGGVAVVVALVLTPLVIGLGDDSAGSSPLTVVRFGGGLSFDTGVSRRGLRRSMARRRRRSSGSKATTRVVRASDPCTEVMERMISCTTDAKVRKALSDRKDDIAAECRKRSKEVRKAKRCVKQSTCKSFEACLSGG